MELRLMLILNCIYLHAGQARFTPVYALQLTGCCDVGGLGTSLYQCCHVLWYTNSKHLEVCCIKLQLREFCMFVCTLVLICLLAVAFLCFSFFTFHIVLFCHIYN